MHVDTVQLDAEITTDGHEAVAGRVVQNDGASSEHAIAKQYQLQSPTGLPSHAVHLPISDAVATNSRRNQLKRTIRLHRT